MNAKLPSRPSAAPAPARPAAASGTNPYWRTKKLEELSVTEWESLCDGCGRCCLVKLEDEDTGEIHFTDIACKLLETGSCRCSNYAHRRKFVRDCVKLTPEAVRTLPWLPPSCAYRLVAEGKDLKWWHPLVSGRPETVHEAGVSVRGRVGGVEGNVRFRDWPDHIADWPGKMPRAGKPKKPADPPPGGEG
jgi:uncharacterized cysteine cluster protein YcgN (CxxCxxCC family)